MIGSFEADNVARLGQHLTKIIEALDFNSHSALLADFSEGTLNTLTPGELSEFGNVEDLLALANSAGVSGIARVTVDHLDAVLTRVGSEGLRRLDADTFGALTTALPGDIISGYSDSFQDAILDTSGANLFRAGGADFGSIRLAGASFDLLADAVGTEEMDGIETSFSLLVDGGVPLRAGALAFFRGDLFQDN